MGKVAENIIRYILRIDRQTAVFYEAVEGYERKLTHRSRWLRVPLVRLEHSEATCNIGLQGTWSESKALPTKWCIGHSKPF